LLADAFCFLFFSFALGDLLNLIDLIFIDRVLLNELRFGQPLSLCFFLTALTAEETEEECLSLILEFDLNDVGDLVVIQLNLRQG
jgi:hypothetical protein